MFRDDIFYRPPNEKDCLQYEEVQRVLREEIVNPLRKNMFVRADRVMKLRTLLEKLSSVSGLTSEEKGLVLCPLTRGRRRTPSHDPWVIMTERS